MRETPLVLNARTVSAPLNLVDEANVVVHNNMIKDISFMANCVQDISNMSQEKSQPSEVDDGHLDGNVANYSGVFVLATLFILIYGTGVGTLLPRSPELAVMLVMLSGMLIVIVGVTICSVMKNIGSKRGDWVDRWAPQDEESAESSASNTSSVFSKVSIF